MAHDAVDEKIHNILSSNVASSSNPHVTARAVQKRVRSTFGFGYQNNFGPISDSQKQINDGHRPFSQ